MHGSAKNVEINATHRYIDRGSLCTSVVRIGCLQSTNM